MIIAALAAAYLAGFVTPVLVVAYLANQSRKAATKRPRI